MTDILVFLAVFWGVWAIAQGLIPDRLSRRLQKNHAVLPWIQRLDPIFKGPIGGLSTFERACLLMGGGAPHRAKKLFLACLGSVAMGFLLTVHMLGRFVPDQSRLTAIGIGALVAGLIVGLWFAGLRVAIRAHQEALNRALPGFLEVLCLCIESGLGVYAALQRTVEHSAPGDSPLQVRIRRILQRLQAGDHFQRAIEEAQRTVEAGPVRQFFETLIQVDRLGGGWVHALKKEASQVNAMRRHQARERASKAGVQLMIPLILFELPALLTLLMGPVVLKFVESLQGIS